MDRSLAALEEGKSSENLQNIETGRGAIASGDFEKRAHDDRETESDFDSLDEDAKSGESGSEAEENDSSDSDIELQGLAVIRPKKTRKLSWSCLGGTSRRDGGPLKTFGEQSWRTLHNAAEVRQDDTYFSPFCS